MSMSCCRASSLRARVRRRGRHRRRRPLPRRTGDRATRRLGPDSQVVPRLIAGLIPQARGVLDADMRAALDEREELIEAHAAAVLDTALTECAPWTKALGMPPNDRRRAATWRKAARTVAAYRDRYRVIDDSPLGAPPESAAQTIERGHEWGLNRCEPWSGQRSRGVSRANAGQTRARRP